MDSEIKKLLEENLAISKENNEMLKKIRNTQRMAQIYRIVYWIFIIGASYGAYYVVQPYLGNLLNVYTGGTFDSNSLKNIGSMSQLRDAEELVKSLNVGN